MLLRWQLKKAGNGEVDGSVSSQVSKNRSLQAAPPVEPSKHDPGDAIQRDGPQVRMRDVREILDVREAEKNRRHEDARPDGDGIGELAEACESSNHKPRNQGGDQEAKDELLRHRRVKNDDATDAKGLGAHGPDPLDAHTGEEELIQGSDDEDRRDSEQEVLPRSSDEGRAHVPRGER
jgi:hypothetical protein